MFLKYAVLGTTVYAVGVGGTLVYRSLQKDKALGEVTDEHRIKVFEEKSIEFDDHVRQSDGAFKMDKLRKRLIEFTHSKPDARILEVAAGSGVNSEWYLRSAPTQKLVWTDLSESMLRLARESAKSNGINAECIVLDGEKMDSVPDDSFDFVIETFGLCSVNRPKAALTEMLRVCAPGGLVLLLEHGKSTNSIFSFAMNWYLNANAMAHARLWGCWWNRDIQSEIKSLPDVAIEKYETHHVGTTHFIVLRKPKKAKALSLQKTKISIPSDS